ncbi:MAG: inorganic triphosphatase, partial [Geminicoccaceae bacterium]
MIHQPSNQAAGNMKNGAPMGRETKRPTVNLSRAMERKLRLIGDANALQVAFDAEPLTSKCAGSGKTVDLENRYVDTEDHRLRAKGLAFRIRKGAKGFRQTLKAGDDAHGALLKRGEWEVSLEQDQLSLDALPNAGRRLIPKNVRTSDLKTIFETSYRRRTQRLTVSGPNQAAIIEAALDLGVIEAEGTTLPIAEIELELLEGEPVSLYQLALELQDTAPLSIETRSKSNRAFGEIIGEPPAWRRATTPCIIPGNTVDQAMTAIFESCFD